MLRFSRVLGILALTAGLQAGPAQAGFAPSNEPIVSAEQLSASGLAMDAAGNSIAAWSREGPVAESRVVEARRIAADGTIGPALEVAPGEQGSEPAVAVTAQGRAFVAWRTRVGDPFDPQGVKGRWVEPDGSLGPLLTLVEGAAGEVHASHVMVAIDPAGVATVVWEDGEDGVLELRRVGSDNALGSLLPDISGGGVVEPEIAALPDGGTVAVWRSGGVEKVVVNSAGEVGPVEKISTALGVTPSPRLAFDFAGNGYAAWSVQEAGSSYSVRARRLNAAGAVVGEELTVDPPGEPFAQGVSIAASTDGKFVISWARQPTVAENSHIAWVRSLDSAAEFLSPPQPISVLPDSAGSVRTAVFDNSSVAAAWGSTNALESSEALGRELSFPGLAGGDAQTISPAVETVLTTAAPAFGVAAFLIYYPISGSARTAELRRFLLPPTCSDSSEALTRDATVAIPLPCTGPAIEGVQILSAPRHGSLGAYDPATGSVAFTPTAVSARNDSFTYAARNDGGSSDLVTVTIRDRVRPRLFSLRLLRTEKRPRVFRVRVVASEPVKPRLVLQRRLPGVLKGNRCRKPRSRAELQRGIRCLRFHKIGAVQKKGSSRRWRIRVPHKFQRALRHGGGFRIKAQGVDRARNKSRVKRINVRT